MTKETSKDVLEELRPYSQLTTRDIVDMDSRQLGEFAKAVRSAWGSLLAQYEGDEE